MDIRKAENDMGKKLIQINTVCNTSTGRIMGDIQREAIKQGYDAISFVGRRKPFTDMKCEKIGNSLSFWMHVAINTVFDRQGYGSYFVTKKIVKRIREEKPDIIHLHNLHGYYLNLPVLFEYLINEFQGKVFWTFHDCWPFTGHCPHFSAVGCDKWKNGCHHCPSKTEYPISFFLDASRKNYQDKKKMFTSISNLTIITPSEWMANWIRNSFFDSYRIEVVNNGIDLKRFSYKPNKEVLDKYGIPKDRKILLGVASVWDKRKGMADFLQLSKKITEEYQIVLVGLSKRQIRKLPTNIIGIERTEDIDELVSLYSLAHIFVNPSTEESFSLVTVEAFACGTPVIVLDTSAVKELVCKDNGVVIKRHKAEDYLRAIECVEKCKLTREQIARTAQRYCAKLAVERVVQLYQE